MSGLGVMHVRMAMGFLTSGGWNPSVGQFAAVSYIEMLTNLQSGEQR
jgi:hypothetical protein